MRNLLSVCLISLVGLFLPIETEAQFLRVHLMDGNLEDFPIADVQKLTSTSDTLRLTLIDESVYAWRGFMIQKLTHETVITEIPSETYSTALSVYPNPSGGSFHIDLSSEANDITQIAIIDIQGRLIDTRFNLAENSGARQETWSATDMYGTPLPDGFYLCIAQSPARSITKKLIVKR